MTPTDDTIDKLVIFLAKRDGIDKLVKTFQYVSKLIHHQSEPLHPFLASRAKLLEVTSGLSRKAFRSGRFLSGFNALRRNPGAPHLSIFANAGEMVYFFFDHFLWLARAGVLDPSLAPRFSFVSAFGESVGYVFFILLDLIAIRKGLVEHGRLISQKAGRDETERKEKEKAIRVDRVMRLMGIAANIADLIIAMADIEPNRFCNHAVTLGISGLVSAWSGWYRNWPA
ncbi:peroxisomal membrane protein 11-4 [Phalaenopsis equestris]|uniref:peroxisomal membrane protein 11-4 n=1 Tax=Phalaenopsis equestris TaxID=78828 RepID=UPI0009E3F9E7|nr:peroxisomal membrane protein 11-4 [Phalaenopsis equestris]